MTLTQNTEEAKLAITGGRRLKYPLNDQGHSKAYIKFAPVKITPPILNTAGTPTKAELMKFSTDFFSGDAAIYKDMLQGGANAVVDAGTAVSELLKTQLADQTADGVPREEDISLDEEANSKTFNRMRRDPTGDSCIMYMPPGIVVQDAVNFGDADLKEVGSVMASVFGQGNSTVAGGAFGALAGSAKSLLSSLAFNGEQLNPELANIGISRISATLGKNSAFDGAIRGTTRISPIANIKLLYDKPAQREFSFTFKMIPTSLEEAKEIEAIVKFFRTELYAEEVRADIGALGDPLAIAYKFPNEIDISMHYTKSGFADTSEGQKAKWIKLKPCYLRSVSSNFNQVQQSFYEGGFWQEVDIQLQFKENELLSKQDVQEGF